MNYTIYHNPRCTKSRQALQALQEKGLAIEIKDYLTVVPSNSELKEVLKKLGIPALELIRKEEAVFKEQFKGKNLTEEEWIAVMIQHPKLIQRPIVIKGNKAVVARPTEMIEQLLP